MKQRPGAPVSFGLIECELTQSPTRCLTDGQVLAGGDNVTNAAPSEVVSRACRHQLP